MREKGSKGRKCAERRAQDRKARKCYRGTRREHDRDPGTEDGKAAGWRETRLRMAAYSFTISCSFRTPVCPVDHPVT